MMWICPPAPTTLMCWPAAELPGARTRIMLVPGRTPACREMAPLPGLPDMRMMVGWGATLTGDRAAC